MHALQNYLVDEPVYDGNAYAFTSTLLGGCLKLYAHHVTVPPSPGQRPEYHTTQLNAYALTGNENAWLEGTGAFRNLRALAKGYRDRFIEDANARAHKQSSNSAAADETDLANRVEPPSEEGSGPLDFFDGQMFAEPDNDQETQGTNLGLAILDQPCGKGGTDDAEASTDSATAVVSSVASVQRQDPVQDPVHCQPLSKLPRTPPSPSSNRATKR